jgi:hypothetical protein
MAVLSIVFACVATLALAAATPLPAYAAPISIDGRETAPQPSVARGVL